MSAAVETAPKFTHTHTHPTPSGSPPAAGPCPLPRTPAHTHLPGSPPAAGPCPLPHTLPHTHLPGSPQWLGPAPCHTHPPHRTQAVHGGCVWPSHRRLSHSHTERLPHMLQKVVCLPLLPAPGPSAPPRGAGWGAPRPSEDRAQDLSTTTTDVCMWCQRPDVPLASTMAAQAC